MQIFESILEQVPDVVSKHYLDENTKRLLLWHLEYQDMAGGNIFVTIAVLRRNV